MRILVVKKPWYNQEFFHPREKRMKRATAFLTLAQNLSLKSIIKNNYPLVRVRKTSIIAQISVKGKLKNRKLEKEDNPEVRWS